MLASFEALHGRKALTMTARKSPLERYKGIGHSTDANGCVLDSDHVDGEEEGNGRESERRSILTVHSLPHFQTDHQRASYH